MEIIETTIFTRRVEELLRNEDYRLLQLHLTLAPDSGSLIPGSGGLRKLRWTPSGRGKRGGARIIYHWIKASETILMLYIYSKSDQEDLTSDQVKTLRETVEANLR